MELKFNRRHVIDNSLKVRCDLINYRTRKVKFMAPRYDPDSGQAFVYKVVETKDFFNQQELKFGSLKELELFISGAYQTIKEERDL